MCFYQKIIDEYKFSNIYILSNGHENPVVDELLNDYVNIKYLHGSIEDDISIIVNAYNLVLPVSTFPMTLIYLNINLNNIFIYEIYNYHLTNINCTIHKMNPSSKYINIMKGKWKNTKEQLDLMLNEKCKNTNITSFHK